MQTASCGLHFLKKYFEKAAEHILKRRCDLICHETALWEYYDHEGKGYFNRSYIEHSLAVLYALSLAKINSINI